MKSYGPVIAQKLCNALIENAEPVRPGGRYGWLLFPFFSSTLARIKRYYGGLWVGGTARLTQTHFVFEPNAVNKAMHKGDTSFAVPLKAITRATLEPGWVTKIIALQTPERTYRVRCFGAAAFLETIKRTAALS
jgi:hypothetical protein